MKESGDKRVRFDDWMGESDEDDDQKKKKRSDDFEKIFAEDKFSKREKKGHLLLQL